MFKLIQKILIGFVMILGIALVAIAIGIGAYLHFDFDGLSSGIVDAFSKEFPLAALDLGKFLINNKDLLVDKIGLGLFAGGISVLGGIIVFGILGGVGQRKSNKA